MRGVYTAQVDFTISAAKTAILLEAPATAAIEILACNITNRSVDSNEQLEAGLFRVTTKGSPAGSTTVQVVKHEVGDGTDPCTLLGNLSAEPTTYQTGAVDKQGFSNLAGYRYDPLPEERPIVSPSGLVGLRLAAAPTTALDITAQIVYRVIGG